MKRAFRLLSYREAVSWERGLRREMGTPKQDMGSRLDELLQELTEYVPEDQVVSIDMAKKNSEMVEEPVFESDGGGCGVTKTDGGPNAHERLWTPDQTSLELVNELPWKQENDFSGLGTQKAEDAREFAER